MGRLTLLLDLAGLALVILAGWLITPALGLFVAGVASIALAYLFEGARR